MENFENQQNNQEAENENIKVEEVAINQVSAEESQENIQVETINENTETTEENNGFSGEKNDIYDFEKVTASPIIPQKDYKPMSKGLKVFAGIMALVIIMTGCVAVGFFFGKNDSNNSFKKISVSLSSKPKNSDEKSAEEVYQIVNKSVVGVTAYNVKTGASTEASGVIYSKDGYVVTNDHVYSEIASPLFKIYDYKGKEYDAVYVAGDTISDLALLKIKDASGFDVPDFGNSSEISFGESVVAIGRPNDAIAESSITKGIISHTKRRMQTTSSYSATLIQTDSAINPGSSGGALANMYGQIVGITSSKLSGDNYESVGFAIPTTTMNRVIPQLAEKGKVYDRAKLGITYKEITSVIKETENYKSTGLYIASISEDSDLYGKSVDEGIITHVNGDRINRSDDMLDVIEESKAGDIISLTIMDKNGNSKDYKVKLKANEGDSNYSLNEKGFSESETPNIPKDNNEKGGTFNFPKGE